MAATHIIAVTAKAANNRGRVGSISSEAPVPDTQPIVPCRMCDLTADLGYLSERNNRQDTPNQKAIAASQTADVRTVPPLDDGL